MKDGTRTGNNIMWNTVFDEKIALSLAHDQMGRVAEDVRTLRRSGHGKAQPAESAPIVVKSRATLVESEHRSSAPIAAEA
jgi:hypothetical protein